MSFECPLDNELYQEALAVADGVDTDASVALSPREVHAVLIAAPEAFSSGNICQIGSSRYKKVMPKAGEHLGKAISGHFLSPQPPNVRHILNETEVRPTDLEQDDFLTIYKKRQKESSQYFSTKQYEVMDKLARQCLEDGAVDRNDIIAIDHYDIKASMTWAIENDWVITRAHDDDSTRYTIVAGELFTMQLYLRDYLAHEVRSPLFDEAGLKVIRALGHLVPVVMGGRSCLDQDGDPFSDELFEQKDRLPANLRSTILNLPLLEWDRLFIDAIAPEAEVYTMRSQF